MCAGASAGEAYSDGRARSCSMDMGVSGCTHEGHLDPSSCCPVDRGSQKNGTHRKPSKK